MFSDPTRFAHLTSTVRRIKPIIIDEASDVDSGYNSSDDEVDNAMDEYFARLIARETRMLMETVYALDHSTIVRIGASPARNFAPIVKLVHSVGGLEERSITVAMEDWPRVIAPAGL